jgi:hypothetical protein
MRGGCFRIALTPYRPFPMVGNYVLILAHFDAPGPHTESRTIPYNLSERLRAVNGHGTISSDTRRRSRATPL